MDDLFKEYYYTDVNIYSNNELWKKIQKDERFDKIKMRRKDFDNWLNAQEKEQIKKTIYKPPKQLTHPIIGKPNTYQTDLMFYKELHKLNNGYDAIINFVEITTKKAYAYPLKSKRPSEVYDTFENFFIEIDGQIDNLEIDKGTEFSEVIKFCKKQNINVTVYNADKNAMSIVERFNRTLRGYIKKNCPDNIWIKKLPNLIDAYNNKTHSSTDYTPNYLHDRPKLQKEIRQRLIGKAILPRLEMKKFKVGDKVRFFKKRSLFGKGGGEYSETVHNITGMWGNSIFLDGDDKKKYRYYNLLKVDKVDNIREKKVENDLRDKVKKEYRSARLLAKEQPVKMSVKETDEYLQKVLNDDTIGKGKRIKRSNSRYQ